MANSGGWAPPVTQQPGYPAYPEVQQPPAYGVPGQTLGMSTFGGPTGLNYLAQVTMYFDTFFFFPFIDQFVLG